MISGKHEREKERKKWNEEKMHKWKLETKSPSLFDQRYVNNIFFTKEIFPLLNFYCSDYYLPDIYPVWVFHLKNEFTYNYIRSNGIKN